MFSTLAPESENSGEPAICVKSGGVLTHPLATMIRQPWPIAQSSFTQRSKLGLDSDQVILDNGLEGLGYRDHSRADLCLGPKLDLGHEFVFSLQIFSAS